MRTVQSDVTAALTDSDKQITYCLNTPTNIACVASVRIVWQETRRRRVWNSTVSIKQLSLTSSTRKIQKSKMDAMHRHKYAGADLWLLTSLS